MSWHYVSSPCLLEEGEDFLVATCSGGDPWEPARLKTIHGRFSCNGKLTESYLDSLSGTTSGPCAERYGGERSMLLVPAGPVKMSLVREKEPVSKVSDPVSGLKCLGFLGSVDPVFFGVKTAQCSLFGESTSFLDTFPRWGIVCDGECWELAMPEHLTEDIGSGYLPTPTVMDSAGFCGKPDKGRVGPHTWPIPTKRDWKDTPGSNPQGVNPDGSKRDRTDRLPMAVYHGGTPTLQTYPTPTVGDSKSARNSTANRHKIPPTGIHAGNTLTDIVVPKKGLSSGQLNPDWVEWLMGWPIGWTDLKPLAMDKFQQWLDSHGIH